MLVKLKYYYKKPADHNDSHKGRKALKKRFRKSATSLEKLLKSKIKKDLRKLKPSF